MEQDEAIELTGGVAAGGSAEKGLAVMATHCNVAAVTLGERGCIVQQRGGKPFEEPAASNVKVVDATGVTQKVPSMVIRHDGSHKVMRTRLFRLPPWAEMKTCQIIRVLVFFSVMHVNTLQCPEKVLAKLQVPVISLLLASCMGSCAAIPSRSALSWDAWPAALWCKLSALR